MWLRDLLWVSGQRTKKKACMSQSESHKIKKNKVWGYISTWSRYKCLENSKTGIFEGFCLWILEANVLYISVKTSTRRGYSSCVHVCVCSCGAISTGGSQRLVYRGLETADVLHSGAVRLHSLHVLVEDGKDLIVEDLVLPNAVCHLLQWLSRENGKKRIKMYKSPIFISILDCEGKTR